jgi:hypothetical protein
MILKYDIEELEQIQLLGIKMLARRALMTAIQHKAMEAVDDLRQLASDTLIHEHALLLVQAEEALSRMGGARMRQILRNAAPITVTAEHPRALPAVTGILGHDEPVIDEDGALTRQLATVESMMQHLLNRTGDDGRELAEVEDFYQNAASYQGRRL